MPDPQYRFPSLVQHTSDAPPGFIPDELQTLASDAAQSSGLDPAFVTRIISAESNWNPRAVSKKGAMGLMQLMPATAAQYGVTNPLDPAQSIKGGVAYLKDLSAKYPNRPDLIAAAYNAGPGAVDKAGGVPNFPETKAYVQKVAPPETPADFVPDGFIPDQPPPPPGPSLTDRAVALLPAAGGVAGGIIGGIGGTVGGFGIGGVPGAVGGAALLGGAGEAAKQLINRARGATAPATPAEAATDIAGSAAIQGGAEAIGAGIGAGASALAPKLMQSAVKPGVKLLQEYRTTAPKLVQTLLDEGVNVTQHGIEKLQTLFAATNAEIRDALASRDDMLTRLGIPNAVIDKKTVAARALQTAGKMAQQTNPTADLKAVGDTVGEFVNHPVFKGNLTLPEAQAMKVGTYQQIGKKYGEVSSAAIETQKALARGLKEDIASEVPGLAGLNSRDSQLMAALDAVGRRVALAGNKDPVGFAWVAAHPTSFLAALFDRSPAIKSLVARGLYNSAQIARWTSPQLIRTAVAALAQASPAGVPPAETPEK